MSDSLDETTGSTLGVVTAVASGGGMANVLGVALDNSLGGVKSNCGSCAAAGVSSMCWTDAEVVTSSSESTYEELWIQ